ncbi:hypothetical protein [Chitinophaga sp.]|uniref:hypothetical protein n=1 Tax=Chitinophaga sp. TaxID=1869181 RepID=UPI002F9481CE
MTEKNGDVYVDMSSILKPEFVSTLLENMHLVKGVQIRGTSNKFIDGSNYDAIVGPHAKTSTSDRPYIG